MHPWTVYPSDSPTGSPRVEPNDAGGELLIVAGVHGDEPSGWESIIEFYREYGAELTKPVSFLFANPVAAQKGVRYIEEDLNRTFGGQYATDGGTYEMQLAEHLQPIIASFDLVLSLHSTQSTDEPFALFGPPINKQGLKLLRRLGISKAVLIKKEHQRGSMITYPNVIEVECGFQHSPAAKQNAKRIIKGAVAFIGGLEKEGAEAHNDVRIFSLKDTIPKPDEPVSIRVDNLTTVPEQTLVAEGETVKFFAPHDFAPILMSANGYEDILGYHGTELGWLSEGRFYQHPRKNEFISNIEFPNKL